MRRITFIILVIAFSSIYYLSTKEDSTSVVNQTIQQVKNMVNKASLAKSSSGDGLEKQQNTSNGTKSDEVDTNSDNLALLNPAQLKNWVEQDSKSMNSVDHNTEEVAVRLKAQARTLLPEQLPLLSQMATDINFPANSRMLSAYVLTLTDQPQAIENMKDLASKALPDFGPVLPHSEAELRRAQELALRYMQVDEIAERAKTDANARDNLILLSTSAESAEVRAYALRKLKSLK